MHKNINLHMFAIFFIHNHSLETMEQHYHDHAYDRLSYNFEDWVTKATWSSAHRENSECNCQTIDIIGDRSNLEWRQSVIDTCVKVLGSFFSHTNSIYASVDNAIYFGRVQKADKRSESLRLCSVITASAAL